MIANTMLNTKKEIAEIIAPFAHSEKFALKYEAVKSMARLASKSHTDILVDTASDINEDIDLRIEAIVGLSRMPGPKTIKVLADILSDQSGEIRLEATRTLACVGDCSTVKALIAAMQDPGDDLGTDGEMGWEHQWDIQLEAIRTLGSIGDPAAVEPIKQLYEDEFSQDLCEVVFIAFSKIGSGEALEFLAQRLEKGSERERRAVVEALVEHEVSADKMRNNLVKALVDKSPGVRKTAAIALYKADGDGALVPLMLMFRDENEDVRAQAVSIVSEIGDESAASQIVSLLKDSHPNVRAMAAKALRKSESDETLQSLLQIVETEKRENVLIEVAQSLLHIDGEGMAEKMAVMINDTDRSPYFRIRLIGALKDRFPDRAHELLPSPVNIEPRQVSVMAASYYAQSAKREELDALLEGLNLLTEKREEDKATEPETDDEIENPESPQENAGVMEQEPMDPELTLIAGSKRSRTAVKSPGATPGCLKASDIAQVLGDANRPEAVEILIGCLDSDDEDLAASAAQALGKLRAKEAASNLVAALDRPSASIRSGAIQALGEIGDKNCAGRLCDILVSDTDEIARHMAGEALGLIKGDISYNALVDGLADESLSVRKACAISLGNLGKNEAVDPLISALFNHEKFTHIRGDVYGALSKLDRDTVSEKLLETLNPGKHPDDQWIVIQALPDICQ